MHHYMSLTASYPARSLQIDFLLSNSQADRCTFHSQQPMFSTKTVSNPDPHLCSLCDVHHNGRIVSIHWYRVDFLNPALEKFTVINRLSHYTAHTIRRLMLHNHNKCTLFLLSHIVVIIHSRPEGRTFRTVAITRVSRLSDYLLLLSYTLPVLPCHVSFQSIFGILGYRCTLWQFASRLLNNPYSSLRRSNQHVRICEYYRSVSVLEESCSSRLVH